MNFWQKYQLPPYHTPPSIRCQRVFTFLGTPEPNCSPSIRSPMVVLYGPFRDFHYDYTPRTDDSIVHLGFKCAFPLFNCHRVNKQFANIEGGYLIGPPISALPKLFSPILACRPWLLTYSHNSAREKLLILKSHL